jgi:hypothetical protein
MKRNFHDMSAEDIGRCMFALAFPRKNYAKLPESVQGAYTMDGARFKRIIENADDAAPSNGEVGYRQGPAAPHG